MRESLIKAQSNYQKKCKVITIRFNKESDADLIEWLAKGNAGARIKALIRENIDK